MGTVTKFNIKRTQSEGSNLKHVDFSKVFLLIFICDLQLSFRVYGEPLNERFDLLLVNLIS